MTSYATLYRLNHPEYYEKEKNKDNERMKQKYANNPEYKETFESSTSFD